MSLTPLFIISILPIIVSIVFFTSTAIILIIDPTTKWKTLICIITIYSTTGIGGTIYGINLNRIEAIKENAAKMEIKIDKTGTKTEFKWNNELNKSNEVTN